MELLLTMSEKMWSAAAVVVAAVIAGCFGVWQLRVKRNADERGEQARTLDSAYQTLMTWAAPNAEVESGAAPPAEATAHAQRLGSPEVRRRLDALVELSMRFEDEAREARWVSQFVEERRGLRDAIAKATRR